ncbi:MAG: sensor histidine kinase, partial [Exiguobacterium sp.]|nr:sensor histidine kinase [Exiguobacterium sp.]
MRRFYKVRQKRSARQKQQRHTFSIASIVEEVQDAMCYIDFSICRLYSNDSLRQWYPSMTTQSFDTLETLTRYVYTILERHGADSAQVMHLIQELLECATETDPRM